MSLKDSSLKTDLQKQRFKSFQKCVWNDERQAENSLINYMKNSIVLPRTLFSNRAKTVFIIDSSTHR